MLSRGGNTLRQVATRAAAGNVPRSAQRTGFVTASKLVRRPLKQDLAQSYSGVHFPPPSGDDSGDPPRPPPASTSSTPSDHQDSDLPRSTDHAVISLFDLFSIGLGPSSSHTIGPMRAALIFIRDILDRDPTLVPRIARLKIALFGALAATGEGHLTPQALLAGFEGEDPEKADPDEVPQRYAAILRDKKLQLGRKVPELNGGIEVAFDYYKDLAWHWDRQLPVHPNGMRFSVFSVEGDLLATNEYFSVGGGFVVNGSLATDPGANPTKEPEEGSYALMSSQGSTSHPADVMENVFYKEVRRSNANQERRSGMAHVEDGAEPVRSPLPPPPGASGEETVAVESTRSASQEPAAAAAAAPDADHIPLPFHNGNSLLRLCSKHNLTIAQIVFRNELTWRSPDEVRARIFHIWGVMEAAIRSGCHSTEELLPGPMKVQRRAPGLYRRLMRGLSSSAPSLGDRATGDTGGSADAAKGGTSLSGPFGMGSSSETPGLPAIGLSPTSGLAQSKRVHGSLTHHPLPTPPRRSISNPDIDRLSAFAIAVNEENAAGRRVVTAPTLGSCGTIPAVLYWHLCFHSDDQEKDVETFLLTCAAIAMLFKRGASISAAEAGCMGEIGVATAMAAAGLTAVLGGTPAQIEHAAEIGIEHNLGMSCDPVGGQVLIPCVERNSMGAVKAVVASQLALSSHSHYVSLDEAIAAMKETAQGMSSRFKETSLAGLATAVKIPVAVPAC